MLPRGVFARQGLRLLLLLSSACSEPGPIMGPSSEPCSPLAMAVTPGTHPTFTWTSACQVEAVTVAIPASGAIVWAAVSPNQTNTIAPSVSYGVTPAGAAFTANLLVPLASGTTHQVTLFRADGGQGSTLRAIGPHLFPEGGD